SPPRPSMPVLCTTASGSMSVSMRPARHRVTCDQEDQRLIRPGWSHGVRSCHRRESCTPWKQTPKEQKMPTPIDSMMSRGLGKVKVVKARFLGLVGVFKTLTKQHGEITALLELAKISDHKFTELWPKIRQELLSHEKAEVREVFPELRAYAATRALAGRH